MRCGIPALVLAAAIGAAPLLHGQGFSEPVPAGSIPLALPSPPPEPAQAFERLPPVMSHEEELLRLEAEAARIIALEGGGPFASGDYAPETTFCLTWLAPGGAAGFGTADFDLSRTWYWQPGAANEPVTITPGVGLHLWDGPGTLDLPPRVYDVYLDLAWRFWNRERWGIAGGITPGFYGDFARLDGNAFQLTGWVIGDWTISSEWSLVGGLAYVRQLQSHLLPVGGAIWRPSDDLRVDFVFPRPRAAWRWFETPERDVWLYLAGIFGGGAWSVDGGAGSSVLVQYSDLRLTFGAEIVSFRGGTTTFEAGYVFSRDISVESSSLVTPDPTVFVQATFAY